jgi:chorismate lyase/3-hydroxybenzoate synthase
MPPCFSRATIATIDARSLLLIGGTASIVGEDSLHPGDAGAQLCETLRNIEALIHAAAGGGDGAESEPLDRLKDVRVYVARPEDAAPVRRVLTTTCAGAGRVELTIARVCRPELLVEIEGVAEI